MDVSFFVSCHARFNYLFYLHVYSFFHSFINSFINSLIHSFAGSLTYLFTNLFRRLFTNSTACLLIYLLSLSLSLPLSLSFLSFSSSFFFLFSLHSPSFADFIYTYLPLAEQLCPDQPAAYISLFTYTVRIKCFRQYLVQQRCIGYVLCPNRRKLASLLPNMLFCIILSQT